MADTIMIMGSEFPRHPSARECGKSRKGRLTAVLNSLQFAREHLTPPERAAYMAVIRAEAMVQTLLRDATAATSIASSEPTWLKD
jgi:hypothetical protein